MNGNNSDWLNDTLPENSNNNNNNNENIENSNNNSEEVNGSNSSNETIENNENDNIQPSSIDVKEISEEKKEIPTLNGMANKVKEEELSEDEKYLLEFIGPNAEKLIYKVFSVPGFIFTSLYMFYRKTYLVGFITLLIQFALMFFIHPLVGLIINVIVGIFFNTFYLSHCNRKIESIKNKTASKDFNNVINLCAEKGGVNKGLPLFGFILIIALVFVCTYFVFPEQKNSKTISNFIDENVFNITEFIEDM